MCDASPERTRRRTCAALSLLALLASLFGACDRGDFAPDPPPGRWRKFRTHQFDAGLTEQQRAEIRKLEALGYASGSRAPASEAVVTRFQTDRAQPGLNFFTSGHAPEAVLMDMRGNVLHRWRYDFDAVWPDYPLLVRLEAVEFWRRAHLFENGDLLAIFEGLGIIKLDRDSNLLWANPIRAHHDLEVMPNGDIYVLTREARLVPRVNAEKPILEDFISILDAKGEEKKRVSLLESFENSEFASLWLASEQRTGDLFHTNTLEVLDGRLADRVPAFAKGNVLTSLLLLDTIAVVDLEREAVVWARKGPFRRQHDPKVLENGNVLIFDNQGRPLQSAVFELDPLGDAIRWQYRGSRDEPFYSRTCGTAERLPNGNTLITESDNGRAFEVTPEREIVWEFHNPHRAGDADEYVATLFELVRLPPDFPTAWTQAARAEAAP
jgi:hypothetical protein